jgi:hypothetical protein
VSFTVYRYLINRLGMVLALAGNKCDLPSKCISEEDAKKLA